MKAKEIARERAFPSVGTSPRLLQGSIRNGPGHAQEPGVSPRFPTELEMAQTLRKSFQCFSQAVSGSWNWGNQGMSLCPCGMLLAQAALLPAMLQCWPQENLFLILNNKLLLCHATGFMSEAYENSYDWSRHCGTAF